MVKWQKRARIGLGLFGAAFAIVVYAAMGERRSVTPLDRPSRLDPRAILESAGAAFQQFREARQDYVIEAKQQLTYEGGSTKFIGVTIKVRNRSGRDFVVSGNEAHAGENRKEMQITGGVKLVASDGFTVTADRATFDEVDATVRIPGAVEFQKGRMSGSGIGMTYDQNTDVLSLADASRVKVVDEAGNPVTEFSSGTATLARREDYLALDKSVHALRGEQVLEADSGLARLSENDEQITFIELRGNARVVGGGLSDSMTARDIDLDYTDDGAALERVLLAGGGEIAMNGEGEGPGRQFAGDSLEATFAPDSSLTRVVGRGNVRVDLPAGPGTSARSITAQALDATGEPGHDLTSARFSDAVQYREETDSGGAARVAKSDALRITLAGNNVTGALFAGRARFENRGLQASGAQAQYDPALGTLRLSGKDAGGGPRVDDAQIRIEADAIDVTLQGPRMTASGNVKTLLHPPAAGAGASAPGQSAAENKLPGLLQEGQAANVSASKLEYVGGGKAAYSGNATLWQGETAIRADVITLDQSRADLVATGAARSNIVFDSGMSTGRAVEIRYDDVARKISYISPPRPAVKPAVPGVSPVALTPVSPVAPTPASPVAPTPASPVAPTPVSPVAPPPVSPVAPPPVSPVAPTTTAPIGASQLIGPQGDLRAARIDVILAKQGSHADRLEAQTDVQARIDTRIATGDRLTYYADDERYVMTGIATVPVKIVEECRETSGRTVTFFKSAERIIVDGNEEIRTQSRRGGPCPQPPAR